MPASPGMAMTYPGQEHDGYRPEHDEETAAEIIQSVKEQVCMQHAADPLRTKSFYKIYNMCICCKFLINKYNNLVILTVIFKIDCDFSKQC